MHFLKNARIRRAATVLAAAAMIIGLSSACMSRGSSAQKKETQSTQQTYNKLVAQQPAATMNYSPTRATINEWIKTWDKPNKLAYVYLQASNGQLVGYYVFKGLPVSYCAALTPTESVDKVNNLLVKNPSVDGVYYSGGECNTYYGFDATNGAYIEYTAGEGISALVYDRPLARQDVQPLGFTDLGKK